MKAECEDVKCVEINSMPCAIDGWGSLERALRATTVHSIRFRRANQVVSFAVDGDHHLETTGLSACDAAIAESAWKGQADVMAALVEPLKGRYAYPEKLDSVKRRYRDIQTCLTPKLNFLDK